jgi:hypothetical protein
MGGKALHAGDESENSRNRFSKKHTNTEKDRDWDKETDITRMKRTTISDLVAEQKTHLQQQDIGKLYNSGEEKNKQSKEYAVPHWRKRHIHGENSS